MSKAFVAVVLVGLAAGGGCVASQAVQCGEVVCPAGNVCSPDGARCALPSQLDACEGAADGQLCTYAGNDGACVSGVCVGVGCGNGKEEPGEVCDDSNTASGDGCSSDCQSDETCGNGYIDAKKGERCDDGNLTEGDGCSADCSESCGNGMKDGGEECDGSDFGILTCLNYDAYEGALECTNQCKVDATACFATCGDADVNGPELCDGSDLGGLSCQTYGWYSGTLTCSATCGGVSKTGCTQYCGDGIVNGTELCDGGNLGGESCISLGARDGALDCNAFCQPSRDRCHWGRWRVQPVNAFFHDVEALSPTDVWTVGQQMVWHFDGLSWTDVSPTDGFNNLLGIYARTAQDIWAVGDFGTILHYDGASWTTVYGLTALTTEPLYDIWASSATDAWAVGANGTILQRTASGWSVHAQSGVVTLSRLERVWGSGVNDVWIVGDTGGPSTPLTVLHYNGSTWSEVTAVTVTASDSYVSYGIWGTGPSDVWIVADAIHHYTGTWSTTASPSNLNLIDLRGTAANDIWANATEGRLVHYDGTSWSLVDGTQTTGLRFWNISPLASGGVWAAADSGVYFYDGPSWRDVPLASSEIVVGMWGTAANNIWGVGSRIFHHDGTSWTQADATQGLQGIWGRTATDIWGVGSLGKIMHYNGSWTTAPGSGGSTDVFYGVWGSAANDVWAVGSFEALRHYNGTTWSDDAQSGNISSGTYHPFIFAIWGSAANDIHAGGDGGLYRYNGTTWTRTTSYPKITQVRAMWGTSAKDVWAVGGYGMLNHFDGTSWKEDPASRTLTNSNFMAVWGTSSNDVWASTIDGGLYHYDGSRWSASTAVTSKQLVTGWGSAPNNHWASGEDGTMLHLTTSFPTEYGASCGAPIPLYCSTAAAPYLQFGSVSTSSTNQFSTYACGGRTESGGEIYYRLDVPVSGEVTVTLTPDGGDLDLVQVGADAQRGCAATGACMASQLVGSGTAEAITVSSVQGQTLYFIVDGPVAANVGYAIKATCIKQ